MYHTLFSLSSRKLPPDHAGEAHMSDADRIEELERQIADLKARLPRHSIPAVMLIELEEKEEELEQLRTRRET
jgi:hypothetical protein